MARFAGRDELFKAAASNDVDFLTSHVQLPSDPASPSSSHASSASSPGTELASAEGQKTSQSGKKLDAEDLNALEDEDGRSLLHVACAAGHLQAVECLLRAGAGFLKADEGSSSDVFPWFLFFLLEGGWTPLLSASSAGHLPVVEALIEAARTRQASGPAAQADLQPNREIVKELLEAKTPSGGTALTTAAAKGHKAVVEALLDAGAEIEATDNYGRTALSKAVVASKEAVVEVLMHRGASVQVCVDLAGFERACVAFLLRQKCSETVPTPCVETGQTGREAAFTVRESIEHTAMVCAVSRSLNRASLLRRGQRGLRGHADLCLLLMRTDPELRFQKNREGVTPFEAGRAPFLKHVATLYEEERGENAEGSATTDLKETE
ncbi:hypothetical protein NCLIV_061280 [Neospora caninum Liverpool]|uniref:Uncharacterized protein n=1 Tax=Neospora caninum (strain Liverpool) TaxID=572307 RepID=F0VPQ6_NEOCL|nr:hypothetical protein NCLIV_061280 [Neospora caninum Liverpool]CBZ55703.1 hypothetical protein NCLIV_061280 [Neospora caninum Liverpool]|eukprot:XP_003885729.1 hypothetical protein NCLIV_061280 [Neospora caninum Liverpool]